MLQIRTFQPADREAVIGLWQSCGLLRAWNDPNRDIDRKMLFQPDWFLVGTLNNAIVASVMFGYDGHRGWVNYLAVEPAHRLIGLARQLMEKVEGELRAVGCPKVNLQIRAENTAAIRFYDQIGFKEDNVLSYGKRLIDD